jgi:hypothetical protein
MEKVICINCGSSGYTASPRHIICSECGGKYLVVDELQSNKEERKAKDDEEENKVFLVKV